MLKYIEIDGKRYAWKDIARLRREQIEAERRVQQPTLFELRRRPPPGFATDRPRSVRGADAVQSGLNIYAPLPRNAATHSSLIMWWGSISARLPCRSNSSY